MRTRSREIATAGHIEHEQGQILFPKPVDWKCGKLVSRPAPREVQQSVRVLSFLARTLAWGNLDVSVTLLTGSAPNNCLQSISERAKHRRGKWAFQDKSEIYQEPEAHLVYRAADNPHRTVIIVHRRANGYAMSVVFVLPYLPSEMRDGVALLP